MVSISARHRPRGCRASASVRAISSRHSCGSFFGPSPITSAPYTGGRHFSPVRGFSSHRVGPNGPTLTCVPANGASSETRLYFLERPSMSGRSITSILLQLPRHTGPTLISKFLLRARFGRSRKSNQARSRCDSSDLPEQVGYNLEDADYQTGETCRSAKVGQIKQRFTFFVTEFCQRLAHLASPRPQQDFRRLRSFDDLTA